LALVLLGAPGTLLAKTIPTLEPGAPLSGRLTLGQARTYALSICAGQLVRVQVEQDHLDLVVRILAPDGRGVAEVDNAADRGDPLTLSYVAARDGRHRLSLALRGRRAVAGRYRIVVDAPRPVADGDFETLHAEASRKEGDRLLARGSAESRAAALERYAEARDAFRAIGDRREEAATLARITDALGGLGRLRETVVYAEETLALCRLAGDRRGEAAALNRLGLATSEVGEQLQALAYLEQALAMRRSDGYLWGQAETHNDIGVALGALGRIPEAIASYTEALRLAKLAGDRVVEAWIFNNRAVDYRAIGETDRALADLRKVLLMFRELGDRHQEGVTEYGIGNTHLDRGEVAQAIVRYERARSLLQETGDKRFEAFTLNHMGRAHLASGKPRAALRDFQLARQLLEETGDQRGEAMASANIGYAQLALGDTEVARESLRMALDEVRESADRVHEAVVLVYIARAERASGDLAAAHARLEEALTLTEALRGSIPKATERASYMATTRDRYDLLIDVLMDLHGREPESGWDARALHASERARARSLVELLAEARIDLEAGADEVSMESDPRYAAIYRPEPLSLAAIQEQVLDGDTLLLEYALGEERSFLFAVAATSLTSHVLPRRSVVEAAARRLYEAWSSGGKFDATEIAARERAVSRMLLGPVADQLGQKRVAIVAEGAIQYVPFSALPAPGPGARVPLVAKLDVVTLPSATTLAVLRRDSARRRNPSREVAVLADAVFDASDPRVTGVERPPIPSGGPGGTDLTRSMQQAGLQRLDRLYASRHEAESIAALAPPGASLTALDFQASRATALSKAVSDARIVHFASHGLLNGPHPELSGIVLSLVDERGEPQRGFLQTHDVYEMDLAAELVVLSACQTALGKEVRGEGLVGLARGFMYAGTPKVVASLWKVPDRATAEFMKRFYRGMLREGLSPAAALSAAQRSFRREKLWSSPYYWAAFTLQGEWE
jgi:CHAT domain-containing protein